MIRISMSKATKFGTACVKAQAGRRVLVPFAGQYYWLGYTATMGYFLTEFRQAA